MATTSATGPTTVETSAGVVQYIDRGEGRPVLFVHGSPGGCDQGELMTAFLAQAGFRVVAPSRPGYLDTPLTDDNATPDAQADLVAALMDALGVEQFAVMCWSGGGPSTYRLAASRPDRVTSVVAIAAVSGPYTFEHPHEEGLLTGRFGQWLMKELARHAPKEVVQMLATEEGDLTKDQARALTEHIWNDPDKREFVVELSATVTGRRGRGLRNDEQQFPKIGDLGLAEMRAPTLLVHGTVDSDVPPEHSEHSLAAIPKAEIIRVDAGTHLAAWTDPTSDEIQQRIATHLAAS
jgi:pimeloyl-ACP methyl ester carboxylesterase